MDIFIKITCLVNKRCYVGQKENLFMIKLLGK